MHWRIYGIAVGLFRAYEMPLGGKFGVLSLILSKFAQYR